LWTEIQADVRVGVAIVSGQISGHVTAQERVELKKTARIFGDILTPVLSLEEGVVFDGHCEMKGEGPKVVNEAMPSIPTDPLKAVNTETECNDSNEKLHTIKKLKKKILASISQ
jgi:cytoskeletal protein CcmA (bactofilin family)